jgi:uncharacterized protein
LPAVQRAFDNYRAILAKVDAFAAAVTERRAGDLACRPGCDACCRVELSVCHLEADAIRRHLKGLPPAVRERLRERAGSTQGRRCVMLETEGTCAIYDARPTVCRTQGLPLRYPKGFVPEEALAGRLGEDGVTWCMLNFTVDAPEPRDVLDAERVDLLVGLANQEHCAAHGTDPLGRVALRVLAGEP